MKIKFEYHETYYEIASNAYRKTKELTKKRDSIQGKVELSDDDAAMIADINEEISKNAITVIIFSAFLLEAYINDYAIRRISKGYLEKYLDKLNLLSKWIVIPRVVTGKQLDTGSEAIQDLSWLISQRNKLAHYKSETVGVEEITESHFVWEYDAERAIHTVSKLINNLSEIDSRIERSWLK